MTEKTLTQQAKELGVTVSYLSQVRHGKRPMSKRIVEALRKQMYSSFNQGNGLASIVNSTFKML